MSEFTDTWSEFFDDNLVTVKIYSESNTGGIVNKTLVSSTDVQMIVQANENSQTTNSEQTDRKLQGKNETGELLFMTEHNYNKKTTIFTYMGLNYHIDQKDPNHKILPHYEYVGTLSKVQ